MPAIGNDAGSHGRVCCRGPGFFCGNAARRSRAPDNAGRSGGRACPFAGDGGAAGRARRLPTLLPILAPLAQLRFEDAELADATALRRRSLKIAIAAYGSGRSRRRKRWRLSARLYIELRRYLDAEPLAIAAANILRARGGEGDPATGAAPGVGARRRGADSARPRRAGPSARFRRGSDRHRQKKPGRRRAATGCGFWARC